jgi:protein-L-isoaspartate(D-aspartate) O-methyltransferase
MNLEQARFNMVAQQVRPARVFDDNVLTALAAVRREDFVPPAFFHLAFAATEIPLGYGQQMFSPELEAHALQALSLTEDDRRILEVGAGSGHMAALLAVHAQQVWSFEIEPALADRARDNLKQAHVDNVHIETGDGLSGLLAYAPFDAIMVSGAVAEVPTGLLDQLNPEGGRLFAIVGNPPALQATLIRRLPTGFQRTPLFETSATFLRGAEPKPRFVF